MYICIKRTGGYGLHAVACAVVATFGRLSGYYQGRGSFGPPQQTIVWKS